MVSNLTKTKKPDSPLPAVVQAVDLAVGLLQVELDSHGRGDLREVNLVSNLKCSYSETKVYVKISYT